MKLYIVTHETLTPYLQEYDIVSVQDSLKGARIVVETTVKDIIQNNPSNPVKIYYDKEIEKIGFNCDMGVLLMDKDGYYDFIKIEEMILNQ